MEQIIRRDLKEIVVDAVADARPAGIFIEKDCKLRICELIRTLETAGRGQCNLPIL